MRSLAELSDDDKDRAAEKARALVQEGAAVTGPLKPEDEQAMRHVFRVLHGMYGNLFLSRYATGVILPKDQPNAGEDEGMVNARRIWAYSLRSFSGETIKAALSDTRKAHPDFPPNEPQFEQLCRARASRGRPVQRDANGQPVLMLDMGQPLRSQYARQARAINAKHATRAEEMRAGAMARPIEPGLTGLKEAIANAIGTAGGDEAEALLRLDRDLTQKVSHG